MSLRRRPLRRGEVQLNELLLDTTETLRAAGGGPLRWHFGLGLFLARLAAEEHGGLLWLNSARSPTRFALRLWQHLPREVTA